MDTFRSGLNLDVISGVQHAHIEFGSTLSRELMCASRVTIYEQASQASQAFVYEDNTAVCSITKP